MRRTNHYELTLHEIPNWLITFVAQTLATVTLGALPPVPSVAGVIEYEQKLLMIDRTDGMGYSLPGGIMRWGESISQTLRREVVEETGYEVEIGTWVGNYSGRLRDARLSTICVAYVAVIVGGQERDSPEGSVTWQSLAKLDELTIAFDHLQIIRNYQEHKDGARTVLVELA